jgi:hypothetical protein
MNTDTNTLSITVNFSNGLEMEFNLNKAIDDLSTAIKRKGLMNMSLECKHFESLSEMYKVEIKINHTKEEDGV